MQTLIRDGEYVREVAGWSDYLPFWDTAVETAPHGGTIVELGVFCGKSLMYLAHKAMESEKKLRIVGVDTFQGSPEFRDRVYFNDVTWPDFPIGSIISECMANLGAIGLLRDVTLIVCDSVSAASLFAPNSVHAVFLDADHTEQAVRDDIAAWMPRVSKGGWIGGHDVWTFPDVGKVVREVFPDATIITERSWWERQC